MRIHLKSFPFRKTHTYVYVRWTYYTHWRRLCMFVLFCFNIKLCTSFSTQDDDTYDSIHTGIPIHMCVCMCERVWNCKTVSRCCIFSLYASSYSEMHMHMHTHTSCIGKHKTRDDRASIDTHGGSTCVCVWPPTPRAIESTKHSFCTFPASQFANITQVCVCMSMCVLVDRYMRSCVLLFTYTNTKA